MLGLFSLSSGFASVPHGGTTCPAVDVVPGLAGMMPSDKLKINLGYDLWSPYVYILNGEPTGFGIEFVKLMQASSEPECQALDIEMVQDHWGRMWYDGETSCTAPLTLSQLMAHEEAKLALTSVECKSQNIKLGDGGIFPPAAPLALSPNGSPCPPFTPACPPYALWCTPPPRQSTMASTTVV